MDVLSLKKRAKLEALSRCMEASGSPRVELDLSAESSWDVLCRSEDKSLSCVWVIDVLEHVERDGRLLSELARVVADGGQLYVSVPRSEPYLGLNRFRRAIGMVPSVYGHVREGYSRRELAGKLETAGFNVADVCVFSGLFTEILELLLNRLYVSMGGGSISPLRGERSARKDLVVFLYRLARPVLRMIASLDRVAFPAQRYGILVKAVKTP